MAEPENPEAGNPESQPQTEAGTERAQMEPVTILGSGGRSNTLSGDHVRAFDFGNTSFLTPLEMRKLRQLHTHFIRSLTARLSLYLRIEIDMVLERLESTTMRNALREMNDPSHLTLVRMAPLRGHSVVEIPIPMSLSIVDRLLGGAAKLSEAQGSLNDVEVSLLDDILSIISSEWANMWAQVAHIQPSIVTHETNPKYLCTSSLDSAALELVITTTIGECKEPIRLIVPHLTLEPLVGTLRDVDDSNDTTTSSPHIPQPGWSDRYDTIPVKLSTWCNGPKLSLKEVSSLNVGQFLPFHTSFFNTAVLRVAGREAFHGNVGKVNEQWAFKIAQPLEN